ncbi:MAG TPA: hypothetical protein VN796_10735 [Acidimicrobiales bacterium]|nr:hypothetical protein [Acidimicrobiales bacterium]
MDILIADTSSGAAAAVASRLEIHGHVVRACRDAGTPQGVPCAALRGSDCPLDAHRVDVAVSVGPHRSADPLGDGDLCAVRRRVPLVLLDQPDHPLQRWAAAMGPATRAVEAVGLVRDAVLPLHSATARHTAEEELRRQGLDATAVDVTVTRRDGALVVDLSVGGLLTRQEAEKLAVHVVQRLRLFDPWAKGIDASVHDAAE